MMENWERRRKKTYVVLLDIEDNNYLIVFDNFYVHLDLHFEYFVLIHLIAVVVVVVDFQQVMKLDH
jgi:hypothetical protein